MRYPNRPMGANALFSVEASLGILFASESLAIRCIDPAISLPRSFPDAGFDYGMYGVKFPGAGIPGGRVTDGYRKTPEKTRIRINGSCATNGPYYSCLLLLAGVKGLNPYAHSERHCCRLLDFSINFGIFRTDNE